MRRRAALANPRGTPCIYIIYYARRAQGVPRVHANSNGRGYAVSAVSEPAPTLRLVNFRQEFK